MKALNWAYKQPLVLVLLATLFWGGNNFGVATPDIPFDGMRMMWDGFEPES